MEALILFLVWFLALVVTISGIKVHGCKYVTLASSFFSCILLIRTLEVKREREKRMNDAPGGRPFETVKITTLARDRNLFPQLLEEARRMVTSGDQGRLVIHDSWNTEWRRMGLPQRKRNLDSVILADGVKERIEKDVKDFLGSRKWYEDRGMFFLVDIVTPSCLTFNRLTLSTGLFTSWPTRKWEIIIHQSTRREHLL